MLVSKQFDELKTTKHRLLYKRLFTFTIIGLRYWMRRVSGARERRKA